MSYHAAGARGLWLRPAPCRPPALGSAAPARLANKRTPCLLCPPLPRHSKYKFNFWRPVTALRARGQAAWAPLLTTPFHPEHPSGHSCAGGAAGAVLTAFFGTPNVVRWLC